MPCRVLPWFMWQVKDNILRFCLDTGDGDIICTYVNISKYFFKN